MLKDFKIKRETQLMRKCDTEGKSIEEQIRLAVTNNSPIESIAPEIYTPLDEGVKPEYDIRTDRQELAIEVTEKYNKSRIMHNDERPEQTEVKTEGNEGSAEGSAEGNNNN